MIRTSRARSVFSNLIDLIVHPSSETDQGDGGMLKEIKETVELVVTPGPGGQAIRQTATKTAD